MKKSGREMLRERERKGKRERESLKQRAGLGLANVTDISIRR